MLSGWRTEVLESEELAVTVLPEKGADIASLLDRRTGIDVLFRAPWGLAPPGSEPREGSGGPEFEFLANYAGGWQELFPSANDPCTYRGGRVPFHGEVATLPWSCERTNGALRCSVRTRRAPFRLERLMRVEGRSLVLEETVANVSAEPAHFVWGHHCVLGAPFVEEGCILDVPGSTVETAAELWEETGRLEPGQREPWPHARLRGGGTVDLSHVEGTEAGSHDDVYVTGLSGGWAAVRNPRLGLEFRLDFDPELFRWVIVWMAYGGARAMPLTGSYALGLEPWTSRWDLERAVAAGEAVELGAGDSVSTVVRATISGHDRNRLV